MAEKDTSKGKCPACRQPYEQERIARMQAIGERSASEAVNKKTKQPKGKRKANEVKDLTNIRVIQRKMAYVTGLPLNLAHEDVLQRKDNFGQYGRVTKVSLSRTIQQFSNDTCSVYITYAKEEEALRCIHAVHDFVLDGRILRASFGTKKYCHAWLKAACNNPACLYLHSIGPDEDSFGKDEDAAEYTRMELMVLELAHVVCIPLKTRKDLLHYPRKCCLMQILLGNQVLLLRKKMELVPETRPSWMWLAFTLGRVCCDVTPLDRVVCSGPLWLPDFIPVPFTPQICNT
ncbi:putative general negative regulator of transcription C16C9.04c isoform X3 [Salvia splendens]|nr:putative general negative regulator of transcription C16C9.04c isoform X3 [Salvia splendens]